jgi:hypothetical protein
LTPCQDGSKIGANYTSVASNIDDGEVAEGGPVAKPAVCLRSSRSSPHRRKEVVEMRSFLRSMVLIGAVACGVVMFSRPAAGDPSYGSDAAFPFPGVAANTVLDAAAGSPVLGPTAAPPATVLPSLISPPNPPMFGEVEDISYGDENPTYFPMQPEFSTAPGRFPPMPEPPPLCPGGVDDDGDGYINDGCPPVPAAPEPFAACANALDDDFDGAINDGCPPVGAPAATVGAVGGPIPPAPFFDVRTEAGLVGPPPFGDGAVYSDVYAMFPGPVPFLPPCGPPPYGNVQILDGDGAPGPPFGPPRLGLNMPEPGSNLDAYERLDDSYVTSMPGPPLIDRPIFFTIDAATAAAWPGGPIPAPTAGAPVLALPTAGDVLAWNPAIGGPVIWATAGAIGLPPASDIDGLAVSYLTGFPLPSFAPGPSGFDFEPAGPPGDFIAYSLAPGSMALSPTSGGVGLFGSVCFGPGTATAADIFVAATGAPGSVPFIDAEQLGLGALRSGSPADDNVDALDICNITAPPTNIDGDLFVDQCDYDDDGDGIGDLADPDDDGDGFGDPQQMLHLGPANTAAGFDNCPSVPNPLQENSDGNFVDTSPPYVMGVDDRTWPFSDALGDACDTDDDNDGILDTTETGGPPCGSASAPTLPLDWDTDDDRYLDGAECLLGTDPAVAASFPSLLACGPAGDGDGDKIASRVEACFYGSSIASTDSDGDVGLDGARDGCEIASLNADRVVNSLDQGKLASGISGAVPYHVGVDVNKDGALNSIDQGIIGSFIVPAGQCP